jgi:hypothetical protein
MYEAAGRNGWTSNYLAAAKGRSRAGGSGMLRRNVVSRLAVLALGTLAAGAAAAQDAVKIGLILPMTGQQTSTGK